MNLLCRFVNWVLFFIRNKGRKPTYPFEDDGVDQRLELHIGPWGSTQWRGPIDDALYSIEIIEDVETIAKSIERDIYGCTHQEAEEEAERRRREDIKYDQEYPPRVIRFLKPNTEPPLWLV